MAKQQGNSTLNYVDKAKVSRTVKNISDIGIDFSIISKRNSRTTLDEDDEVFGFLSENEYLFKDEYMPYQDMAFENKIQYLWNFASSNEIEFILNTICDSFINYDEFGYFCDITTKDAQLNEETKTKISKNFKKIYNLLGFDDGEKAWELCLEWLIEGYKTFEIIFQYKRRSEIEGELLAAKARVTALEITSLNESLEATERKEASKKMEETKELISIYESKLELAASIHLSKNNVNNSTLDALGLTKKESEDVFDFEKDDLVPVDIIGMKAIPSNKVAPIEYIDKETGRRIKIWKVFLEGQRYTVLSDNQIVQIQYSKVAGSTRKISYVERLLRNYNLTRKLEESRVAWNILNSQFRIKMTVPLGNKVSAKAKQALKNFTDRYKEELFINDSDGGITVNGNTRLNYVKTFAFPNRGGNSPEIDSIAYQGPDLKDMDVVEYFRSNMWRDSFVPSSRFDRSGNIGALSLFRADGIPYDEIAFHNFLKRLKTQFEAVLKKPTYIQTLLDFPELKIDVSLKNKIGFTFRTSSYFEEAKKAEIDAAKLNNISTLEGATGDDGQPLFPKKYLYVDRSHLLSEEEWNLISEMKGKTKPAEGGADAGSVF
jgi:hypothetical protein